jgi:5-methylcytosine-specific restriction enzyme A
MSARPRIVTILPRISAIDPRAARPAFKHAAPIYSTAQYLQWRTAVLANANGQCQWPGCGRAERRMFADHVIELQDGGAPFDVGNGQCLCGRHHTIKTNVERVRRHTIAGI